MTPYENYSRRPNWKIGLVVLIISLLIHQGVFWLLKEAGLFDEEKKEEKMEVTLLETPKKKKKPNVAKKKEQKKKVEKKISKPAPKPKPRPQKPLPKPKPVPKVAPKPALEPKEVVKPTPKPMGPELPLPPATSPKPAPPSPPKLKTQLTWGAFERTMGETAKQERLAYNDKLLKKRGGGFKFGKMTARVQRSIHNHKSWVAGAPKEPVGAKQAIFKNYLEATHDQIHELFAHSFLPSLISLGANHPLNDFSLMTLVEFRILENGVVDDIHVIKTSGHAVFDAAPVDTLYRASPFLPPPKSILSYDKSVYFRWGFYRNQRKCGTFNATGYILKGPSEAPTPISGEQYTIDG